MNPLLIRDFSVLEFERDLIISNLRLCRPRILIVTEPDLSYGSGGFGLLRVLEALTTDSGVSVKPVLTLAYRGVHPNPNPLSVGADSYTVLNNFNFATAATAVTVANYDQIWLFGRSGSSGMNLPDNQIEVIARFMNAGGGVFATGDHGAIGQPLCGSLPRIRRMREWSSIPMGGETNIDQAVQRIDTVVDPGANGLYDFNDQGDNIPQRIFPHYTVTAHATTRWQARVHPLLMLPGAPVVRDGNTGNLNFNRDIDVLPDHPHESVCYAVTNAATLGATYTVGALSFAEFPVQSANPAQRVPATLVASGVSGGRSVQNGVWKPPVQPRMFGLISAWDGRLANAYAGQSQRPGRIVCDSTWHHYVNVNLNGMRPGGVPDANLQKIYSYYRNIQSWLQPANRVWCRLWWDLLVLRLHPRLVEELSMLEDLKSWPVRVGLGREALAILREEGGAEAADEFLDAVLQSDRESAAITDLLANERIGETHLDPDSLRAGALGAMLARIAEELPNEVPEALLKRIEAGPERDIAPLTEAARSALREGLSETAQRAKATLGLIEGLRPKADSVDA
jgi:hypothetical protein